MKPSGITDEQIMASFAKHRSVTRVAEELGVSVRNMHTRRRQIEAKHKKTLMAADHRSAQYYPHIETRTHPAKHPISVNDGQVVIFSDAHFWPNVRTTAFRGLLNLTRQLKPMAVINNGDAFDGASISRHPRIGWDSKPSVADELKACDDRLGEIQEAAGAAKLFWTMGNHDARYETFLAANAPQFQGVGGFSLKDKFPAWIPCWSVFANDDVVIKHRLNGGIHATHNNTLKAGRTIVTGHLHSLKVTPFDDYNGTRWGVDTGTLADPHGPQFEDYLETSPTNWRSGFIVMTWKGGRLLWPEIARVWDNDHIEFRGEIINVRD
jgi:hypothetical protein